MTDISPEDRDLIDRYLAGRLTDAEVLVIDTRIVAEPGFRNEFELTQAMREGLRELHNRGEVAPLLSRRQTTWRHPRFALAASLTAVALGLASFLFYQRLEQGPQAVLTESLRFERTRGAGQEPDVVWQQSASVATLRLQLDVGLEPSARYRVAIERIGGSGIAPVFEAAAPATPDGIVTVDVDAARLDAGDYAIRLDAVPTAAGETVTYALRVSARR